MKTPKARKGLHSLTFILITCLIDSIGFGIVMPVMPDLIRELTHQPLDVAARDAGWLGFAYAAMQFVFGPVIGGLSDKYGRRPILIASLLAFGLDYLLCGVVGSFGWLFIGRLVAGITGASYVTANSYIADISPAEKRAQNFGLIGAAFGIGFMLGPAVGGLIGQYGVRMPFYVAAGLALLNAVYGYFFLTESLSPDLRRPFSWKVANPVGVLMALRKYHPSILVLATAIFFFQLGGEIVPVIWAFFGEEKLKWNAEQVGFSLAAYGLTAVLVQGVLSRIVVPRLGEYRTAIIGLWTCVLSLIAYAFAPNGLVLYLAIVLGAPGDLAYLSMAGLASQRVDDNAQGELQGAIASFTGLAAIIAPPVSTQIFAYFIRPEAPIYLPGAPFLLSAGLISITLIFLLYAARRWPETANSPAKSTERGSLHQE